MFDIKSGVLVTTVIALITVVLYKHSSTLNELKQLTTKMEVMKDFHSTSQETLELETNNRKSESRIHMKMITELFETIG